MGIPHDLPIEISLDGLVDPQGKSPRQKWIVPDREKLLLKPGKAETLKLTITIPDKIEEELVDGLWNGKLGFTRKDIGETLAVKRFQKLHGVPDEEAVDLVSFALRRPQLEVRSVRCLRNTVRPSKDGKLVLPVPVSIYKPFSRTVVVSVSHTSVLSRDVNVLPEGTFVDAEGRQIPSVRLIHAEPVTLAQEIVPGATARWRLHFEADEQYPLQKAYGKILISGPGVPSLHLTVEICPRSSLLGTWVWLALWIIAAILVLLLVAALVRLLRASAFQVGREVAVSQKQELKGVLQLKETGKGQAALVPQQPVTYRFGDDPPKRLGENRPMPLRGDEISPSRPLVITEQRDDGQEGWSIALTEQLTDPPEIRGEIQAAPIEEEQASRCRQQFHRRIVAATTVAIVAWLFFTPPIVRSAQWIYDFFTL